jgi:hypothetical protein
MSRKLKGVMILAILMGITIFGPYNIISEFTERSAIKSFISSNNTFKGIKIVSIDYKGSETYFIRTQDGESEKNFIVMRYNSSVMNGHWKVFEETSREHYY